jgi:hypothetical protein
MSAAEIIELIKKLPPEERAAVVAFVKEGGAESEMRVEEAVVERTVRYIPLGEAEKIAEGIFDRHEELFRKLAQ